MAQFDKLKYSQDSTALKVWKTLLSSSIAGTVEYVHVCSLITCLISCKRPVKLCGMYVHSLMDDLHFKGFLSRQKIYKHPLQQD